MVQEITKHFKGDGDAVNIDLGFVPTSVSISREVTGTLSKQIKETIKMVPKKHRKKITVKTY